MCSAPGSITSRNALTKATVIGELKTNKGAQSFEIPDSVELDAIAFVGESATGSAIMRQGSETLKRVHFELGGKNPVVVFDDADFDRALDAAIFMIYSLNGERCTSSMGNMSKYFWGAIRGECGRPMPRQSMKGSSVCSRVRTSAAHWPLSASCIRSRSSSET